MLYLNGHGPISVREQLQAVAESPLSLIRNDHYGRGGFVTEFEAEIADLLGKESAVFMPSGTMAQQIALRIWSDRLKNPNVAFHPTCHLEIHEQNAYRFLHRLNGFLVGHPGRLITIGDLEAISEPISTLLLELPQREIGGQLPSWEALLEIQTFARSRGWKLHLDGARLWECQPFYSRPYSEIAQNFDSVYVSFYKILGGLPGAALAGPSNFIDEARIWLRRHGGNLQQQSPSAISAKLGLDEHLSRISEYVAKAAEIVEILQSFPSIEIVPKQPPTNMMHLYFNGDPGRWVAAAQQIREEDQVSLFQGLGPNGKMELNVGLGALEIERNQLTDLFAKLTRLVTE